jgi:hypothetical protein
LEIEWDQARNITTLLGPLLSATNVLCASKYPSLNKALPVYILLMSQLHSVKNGLYNQSQAIIPATQMIHKLDQYLRNAISKPA